MIKYRREIDGLRALAVIPVILFHAGFSIFSGGFIGVDIFFVISGYLIASIILSEYKSNTFSFLRFYERRARRILPALFFIIIVTLPFTWLWITPSDLKEMGGSIATVAIFASNFYFRGKMGYFETAAETKPYLHTWSLAVEEQFYLLFPICLIILLYLLKHRPGWVLSVLFASAIVSLGLADWGTRNMPIASFFLLPTRGWELMVGVMIAFGYQYYPEKTSTITNDRLVRETASFIGFCMIVAAVMLYTEETPFPGIYALLPTLGAALIILFCTFETFIGRILSSKLFVGIGLISYSAYLWHHPIFALARHYSIFEPSQTTFLVLTVLSFILAALSWRFVERPFRQKSVISSKRVVQLGISCSIIITIIGYSLYTTNGFERQWASTLKGEAKVTYNLTKTMQDDIGRNKIFGECSFPTETFTEESSLKYKDCYNKHGPGIAVIGDSHGQDLFGAINRNMDHPFIVGIAGGGCRPHTHKNRCPYDNLLTFVQENPQIFSFVIFEQAGFYLLEDDKGNKGERKFITELHLNERVPDYSPDENRISKVIDYLYQLSQNTQVIWLGPRMDPHISAKQVLKYGCDYNYKLRPNLRKVYKTLDERAGELVSKKGTKNLTYISQINITPLEMDKDFVSCNILYWRGGDHWTAQGEKYFGKHALLSTLM
jgi:peptidoglycan/LPS O-acetylase OafA/YrhL